MRFHFCHILIITYQKRAFFFRSCNYFEGGILGKAIGQKRQEKICHPRQYRDVVYYRQGGIDIFVDMRT